MKGFEKLDIDSKSIVLRHKGQIVASIKYYNYRATLYFFNNIMVEEYYDTESKEIARICIATDNDLKKYLDKISLSDLLRS